MAASSVDLPTSVRAADWGQLPGHRSRDWRPDGPIALRDVLGPRPHSAFGTPCLAGRRGSHRRHLSTEQTDDHRMLRAARKRPVGMSCPGRRRVSHPDERPGDRCDPSRGMAAATSVGVSHETDGRWSYPRQAASCRQALEGSIKQKGTNDAHHHDPRRNSDLLQGLGHRPPGGLQPWLAVNADAWDQQLLFMAANGFRAIAHDRRGHGRSSQPWEGNDMDHYADDLAYVMNTLDLHDGRRSATPPEAARSSATSAGMAHRGSARPGRSGQSPDHSRPPPTPATSRSRSSTTSAKAWWPTDPRSTRTSVSPSTAPTGRAAPSRRGSVTPSGS